MKLRLFTKKNCPQCVLTKVMLKKEGHEFDEITLDDDMGNLKEELVGSGIDVANIKSAPVLLGAKLNQVWTGHDCAVAVEFDELDD